MYDASVRSRSYLPNVFFLPVPDYRDIDSQVAGDFLLRAEHFYSSIVSVTNALVEEGNRQLSVIPGFQPIRSKPVLESLNVPGLWARISIPTPATVAILDQLIASGKPHTHVVFPGFGHNLDAAPSWSEIDRWLAQTIR